MNKKMTKNELVKRLVAYCEIVESYYSDYVGIGCAIGDVPSGWNAKIVDVKTAPKRDTLYEDLYEVVALVHRDAQTYEYDIKIPGDEGWGVKSGVFVEEEDMSFPAFVLDDDFWEIDLRKRIDEVIVMEEFRELRQELEMNNRKTMAIHARMEDLDEKLRKIRNGQNDIHRSVDGVVENA